MYFHLKQLDRYSLTIFTLTFTHTRARIISWQLFLQLPEDFAVSISFGLPICNRRCICGLQDTCVESRTSFHTYSHICWLCLISCCIRYTWKRNYIKTLKGRKCCRRSINCICFKYTSFIMFKNKIFKYVM